MNDSTRPGSLTLLEKTIDMNSEEKPGLPPISIGRIVHYKLSEEDARSINRLRFTRGSGGHNYAVQGQVYPAMIVRLWDPRSEIPSTEPHAIQLQVFLDGDDTYWATSRHHRQLATWHEGTFGWPGFSYEQE